MNIVVLPALDGRKPLGFLAALGLTRLLEVHTDDQPRLAWSPTDGAARLHTGRTSIDDIVDALEGVLAAIPEGGVLPGVPIGMPPLGAAPDGLRLPPKQLRALVGHLAPAPTVEVDAWLSSLVTDLSLDEKGRCDISLMAAPSGTQSMRTMLEKPLAFVRREPACLREALLGWRRRVGYTGEYLDHQVLFDGADSGVGKSQERGVPGATWLALWPTRCCGPPRTGGSRSPPAGSDEGVDLPCSCTPCGRHRSRLME